MQTVLDPARPRGAPPADRDRIVADVLRATRLAFQTANAAGQEHRDPLRLTMSGVGSCLRRSAYCMAATFDREAGRDLRCPPTDLRPRDWPVEEARAAMLGTWIHEGLLPALRTVWPDSVIEDPVELRVATGHGEVVIPGTLDLARDGEVGDLKTLDPSKYTEVVRDQVARVEHRFQVLGYATARRQAGHRVTWLWWLHLDRGRGGVEPVVEPYTVQAAAELFARVRLIADYGAGNPDAAPREGRGPGLSPICSSCPWLRRCWGPTAVPGQVGAQTILAATPAGVVAALTGYADAAARAGRAKKDQEFFKAVLGETPPGVYDGWKLGRDKDSTQVDQAKVDEDYQRRGLELPRRPKAGGMRVTRVKGPR